MNLSKLSVKRPVAVIMVTLIAVILGAVSLTRLPIDLMPQIQIPIAIVSTSYSGVGPQEIEELITKPIENAIATVSNIKSIRSTSSEGNSIVIAEFGYSTDMEFAALEMREKVDMAKRALPSDAAEPMVLKIDPNAMAVMDLSISNGEDLSKLQTISEDSIKPRLERLPGVASVTVSGGYENQIEVVVNQERLRSYGLSMDQLAQVLRAENLNLPGGEVNKGSQKLTVRTKGELQSLEELRSLPIGLPSGSTIYMSDIAQVQMKNKDITSITKTNGSRSISISIQKQSGTNTVQVADVIHKEIENIKRDFPDFKVSVVTDQSTYIKDSINNVVKSVVIGGVLAILVLFLFLRNIRSTLVIGAAIPVSIITTFALMYFNGITINMMTLGGLALGVGMLVDNAIVVLENIYRFRQEGYSRVEAAIKGAQEVGTTVIASTLTTVIVFLPIVFVEGITSIIFKELALTISMALGASLVVSLTLVPMLSSKLLKVDEMQGKAHKGRFKPFNFLYDLFDKILLKMEIAYKRILGWSLKHRKSTIVMALVVFVVSMGSLALVGTEFFPASDEGQFSIGVTLPVGSELEDTNEVMETIEGKLEGTTEIETVFSNIGASNSGFGGRSRGTNRGSINVVLKSLDNRDRSTNEIADEVRKSLKDIPGAQLNVQVSSSSMLGGGTPIDIKIKGDDLNQLKQIGEDIKQLVGSVEGTREVKSSMEDGIPEVSITVNRRNASQYSLTATQIASSVKGAISGQVATRYKFDGNEIDIVVKGSSLYQESISNLEQTPIRTSKGIHVPLGQVADVTIERGPVSIGREGQVRTINVTSQIMDRDLGSITTDIQGKLEGYQMPKGYVYEMGGENQEMVDSFKSLGMALLLAIVLMYMILASQFESLLHPFTIMLSVPLALAGGALGLFITGRTLNVPAIIGVIMLSGIVVNNAIVLVDYINTRRSNGEDRTAAIIAAGPIRLRPILMTALTTILGLLPLALGIGEGAEIQAPMATVVIGGLILSTLLTLIFIPVMYTLFDDLSRMKNSKLNRWKPVKISE